MTDAIKPPGSGLGPSAIASRSEATPAGSVAASSGVSSAASSESAAGVLAAQLKSGAMSPAEVINSLVTKALDQARAQGLPAAEQDNLEAVLRAALANDPTLSGLARELER